MINEFEKKPNEIVIKAAEEFLARAKSGEIHSFAIAGTTGDGCVFNEFIGGDCPISLLGELRLLERDLIDICCETRRKVAWEFTE